MLLDDVFRLRDEGQGRVRPCPALKHGWIVAELSRLDGFVCYVSQTCYRRGCELGGTAHGRAAGANPPRLASIGG